MGFHHVRSGVELWQVAEPIVAAQSGDAHAQHRRRAAPDYPPTMTARPMPAQARGLAMLEVAVWPVDPGLGWQLSRGCVICSLSQFLFDQLRKVTDPDWQQVVVEVVRRCMNW